MLRKQGRGVLERNEEGLRKERDMRGMRKEDMDVRKGRKEERGKHWE